MRQKNVVDLSLDFSVGELWFLLQQFGSGAILGMKNPYLGWLIEEIEAAQRTALRSLVDRDIVRIASKDQIELDDVLAAMIRICAHPQHTLISQFQDSTGKDIQRFIHFGKGLIVEHNEFKPGQHRLTAIKDRDVLLAQLNEVLRLSSTAFSRGGNFCLPEQILFEARSLCSEGQARKAQNILKKAQLSDEKAALLSKALTSPVANSAFVTVLNQDKPEIQNLKGFALLEGKTEFWILLPYDKAGDKMVEFVPANPKLVKQRFLEILP